MNRFRNHFLFIFTLILTCTLSLQKAVASHIPSGELHWECITSGPDAGKFIIYMTAYRDCSIPNQTIANIQLTVHNVPTMGSLALNLISQTDVTPASCNLSCADAIEDISLEQYIFASAPVAIPGPPPPQGYTFTFETCCRIDSDNLVNANNATNYYSITMYPYNNLDTYPCYDNSPQFAERPSTIQCAGTQMRYNSNAIDPDLDSLSYEFVPVLGTSGNPIPYVTNFSPTEPVPGPSTNPAYDLITLDPVTGQFEYDSSPNVQGRFSTAIAVSAWRCGQRISRTTRDMTISFMACNPLNNSPTVAAPIWNAPATASGYAVTVQAGDLVNFNISGSDLDFNGPNPQMLTLTATGSQFGTNFTNAAAGCVNAPCATLSNVVPPSTAIGNVGTEFNWQTTCDHVSLNDDCASYSSTYNFIFKFRDDYCPSSATNMVNVAVTVVGDPVVPSPAPHCVSVAGNGDITLTWAPVVDNAVPPSFVEYAIMHSTSPNGPFQQVGTVANINTGTYVHTTGNPVAPPSSAGPNYYVIRTRSGCNDAVLEAPVDTVASIHLNLVNNGSTAGLSWNPLATPDLPSSNVGGNATYEVWQLVPGGVWTMIGSTTSLTYTDPIIWCNNELISYRIQLGDNLGCTSVSNIEAEILNNPAQPDPQPIDSVSVDPATGLVTICWPQNTSTNVIEYNVYWNPDMFAWDLLQTVPGFNTTCWTDPNADPSLASVWYQVTATNNCGQEGLAAGSGANGTNRSQTIWLQDSVNGCEREAYLYWTPYWYWAEGVKEYEIYSAKDGQPYTKVATVADSVNYFVRTSLEEKADYCHFVRAVKNSLTRVTASSNVTCSYVYVPKRPDYDYNYNTTVIPGNTGIKEYFFCDSTAGYIGFDIQRGKTPTSLSTIWFVPFDANTRYYEYTDPGAQPDRYSYYYSIIGVDSCQLNADTMNMSRTVFLEAKANQDRTNTIEWNPYEGWRGNVVAYNIYRSVDGPFTFLTTVSAGQLTYTDSIQEIIIGEGNFCYYIEAVEGIGPPVGPVNGPPPAPVQFQELSLSNSACARQHPNVFMPNAFMPEGVNNIFKPVTVYVDADSYLFQIYNRWGERVFETTNPERGWTGISGGKPQPQGAYVYFISFVSSNGQTYTKSGSVTLIR